MFGAMSVCNPFKRMNVRMQNVDRTLCHKLPGDTASRFSDREEGNFQSYSEPTGGNQPTIRFARDVLAGM